MHQVAFIAEDDLLSFAAVCGCADRVPGRTAVGLVEMGIPDGLNRVVAADVDGRHVDRVIERAIPVRRCVQLASLDIVHAGFMEGIPRKLRNEFLRDVGPEDVVHEAVIVRDEGNVVDGLVGDCLDLVGVLITCGQSQQVHMRYVDHPGDSQRM